MKAKHTNTLESPEKASNAMKADDCSSEEEDSEDYRKGGYHPIKLSEKFNNGAYEVVGKLGWGHFSTVWMAKSMLAVNPTSSSSCWNSFVALKVVKSEKKYVETALDEIKLLNASQNGRKGEKGENFIVKLLDSFTHEGPNGKHVCMAFELMGCNLLKLIKKYDYKGLPVPMVKRISRQVLLGLKQLHDSNIIHTDLKPENVLIDFVSIAAAENDLSLNSLSISSSLSLVSDFKSLFSLVNERNIRVKLADLGNACWIDHHFTEDIQTRQYRSPEVLIGAPYNETTDLWSFSCIVRIT